MVPIACAEMADGGEVRLGGNANAQHRKSLKQAAKDMGVPRSLEGPFCQSKKVQRKTGIGKEMCRLLGNTWEWGGGKIPGR